MKRSWSYDKYCDECSKIRRTMSEPHKSCDQLNVFLRMPHELQNYILSFLKIDDLVTLLSVSKGFQFMVEMYLLSSHCIQLWQFYNPRSHAENLTTVDFKNLVGLYKKAGFALRIASKRFSFIYKLQFLEFHLKSHMFHVNPPVFDNDQDFCGQTNNIKSKHCNLGLIRCPALYLYGHFLKNYTSEWSENQFSCAFHTLVQVCFQENFWFKLTSLICQAPGENSDSELTVRLFLRRVFLDPLAVPISSSRSFLFSSFSGNQTIGPTPSSNLLTDSPGPSQSQITLGYQSSSINTSSDLIRSSDSLHNISSSSTSDDFISTHFSAMKPHEGTEINGHSELLITQFHSNLANIWPAAKSLIRILKTYPIVHQARILFILYGPLHKGRLMWRTMCENTAADSEQLAACFGELGAVLSHMLESGIWTPKETIFILDELTIVPEDWLAENVACLLYTSGPRIASLSIVNKANLGRTTELAVTLTSLCLVQVKIRANLTDLIKLVGEAYHAAKDKDKTGFLDQLARSFQDVIVDLYETDELEERIEDFSTILRAQSEFMRALMSQMYEE